MTTPRISTTERSHLRQLAERSTLLVAVAAILGACSSSAAKGTASHTASSSASSSSSTTSTSSGTGTGGDATMNDGGGGGAVGPVGDATGVQAGSAATFLSTIGVCVHVTQGVDDPTMSATAMSYAGIRNFRDDGSANSVASWIAMHQQAGVLVDFLPVTDIATEISMAKELQTAGALLSIEGPNEPNNFPVTYAGQTSSSTTFTPVAQLQRDLYSAVRNEPTLAQIPVFHSSEAGGSEPDDVGLQFLTIPADAGTTMPAGTPYADFANTHNYVCGHSSSLVDNVCWNAEDPTLNSDWDGLYVEYGHTWNKGFAGYSTQDLMTLPRVTTETGWTTQGDGSITEEQQARVFLNLYLSAYARGWRFTFIYMLRDDPVQGYWGLFDTGYQPKTSGTYLHNLTTILADDVASATGKLDYAIASEPMTVHDVLLQKKDGTFELVVWDERPSGGTDAVTVSLGKMRASVKVYDPTTGTAPTQTLAMIETVSLTLSDHPVVIELAP